MVAEPGDLGQDLAGLPHRVQHLQPLDLVGELGPGAEAGLPGVADLPGRRGRGPRPAARCPGTGRSAARRHPRRRPVVTAGDGGVQGGAHRRLGGGGVDTPRGPWPARPPALGSWRVICWMAGSTAAAFARDGSRLKASLQQGGGLVPLLLADAGRGRRPARRAPAARCARCRRPSARTRAGRRRPRRRRPRCRPRPGRAVPAWPRPASATPGWTAYDSSASPVLGPDGDQAAGGDGGERLVQAGRLAVAAEPLPQVGPVAVEDGPVAVRLFQAAQEPEQVPLAGRQGVRDRPGPGGEHVQVVAPRSRVGSSPAVKNPSGRPPASATPGRRPRPARRAVPGPRPGRRRAPAASGALGGLERAAGEPPGREAVDAGDLAVAEGLQVRELAGEQQRLVRRQRVHRSTCRPARSGGHAAAGQDHPAQPAVRASARRSPGPSGRRATWPPSVSSDSTLSMTISTRRCSISSVSRGRNAGQPSRRTRARAPSGSRAGTAPA